MSDYPYDNRDLFEFPENYFYAKCDSVDYLDSWKMCRQRAILRLKDRVVPDHKIQLRSSVGASETENGVSLNEVLADLYEGLVQTSPDLQKLKVDMDFLVVKYEVFKQLDCYYSPKRFRLKDSVSAGINAYIVFAKCLVVFVEKTGNLKYLSTLIKVCDAFLNCSFDLSAKNVADIIGLWKAEMAFVDRMVGA